MSLVVPVALVALLAWALVARRFERWGVAGPAVLLVIGAVVVALDVSAFAAAVDSPLAEKVVELILALILFVDASEVRGGIFGSEPRIFLRLILIALPLALILVTTTTLLLLPEVNILVAVVMAAIILPIDFSATPRLLRDRRVSPRVRESLNVEGGYADGLISPLFGMALALAVALPGLERLINNPDSDNTSTTAEVEEQLAGFGKALFGAIPAMGFAILIGLVLGALFGILVRISAKARWSTAEGIRVVMLVIPLLAFALAEMPMVEANGFVSAFVAGVTYRLFRTRKLPVRQIPHEELFLVEEVSTTATQIVWFILGGVTVLVFSLGVNWFILLLALLGLTVLRIAPVWMALLGSKLTPAERIQIGAFGSRGAASIVFGLLAMNALPDESGYAVLTLAVFTVVGSILLHGVGAPALIHYRARRGRVTT